MASLLIVDDDEIIFGVLSELFSHTHLCHTAPTAEEALAQLGQQDFDAVITDLSMPGMSGEDLLGFIKVHSPKTPVLFISGSGGREMAERLQAKGAFGYLVKPFPLDVLVERVERMIGQRQRPAVSRSRLN